MPQIAEARPPYVSFETRALERRTADGVTLYDNVDFVKITPQGSRDIIEKEVKDWLSSVRDRVRANMYPEPWLENHEKAYKYWKETNELPLDGTPIKGWPLASQAEQARLIDIRIKTVEDLANANQETIQRLGMGGVALKTRAVNFLEAKSNTGPLVGRIEALTMTVQRLTEQVQALTDQNTALKAVANGRPGSVQIPLELSPPEPTDLSTRLAIAQQSAGPDVTDVILGNTEE